MNSRIVALAIASPIVSPAIAAACAVCISGAEGGVADAFNWSVLFLMASPYAVVGSVAGWFFYRHRRVQAEREASEQSPVYLGWTQKESGR